MIGNFKDFVLESEFGDAELRRLGLVPVDLRIDFSWSDSTHFDPEIERVAAESFNDSGVILIAAAGLVNDFETDITMYFSNKDICQIHWYVEDGAEIRINGNTIKLSEEEYLESVEGSPTFMQSFLDLYTTFKRS
jgi:hypothetical protein